MSLLVSNSRAGTAFTPIAEGLLREISAFGVMAAGQDIRPEQLEQYASRIAAMSMMLEVAEQAAELRFGDDKFPFVYNTAKWDEQTPLAGWTTDSETPRPSQLPWSMLGGWMMALQEPDRSMRNRLLRAVLWQTSRDSLRTGLQLAVDLSGAGFLLNRDDLTRVVALVLLARDQVDSDREMVGGLLGGTMPSTPQDFLRAPLTPDWVTRTEATSEAVLTLIQQLIQMITPAMASARSSSSLGDWVLGQQRLYNLAAPVLNGITVVLPKLPLALRAVMTQLREINADAGNYAELLKIKLYRIPSYRLVAEAALSVALQFKARLGTDADWTDRLCRERVVVPDELRTLVLDITGEWLASPLDSQAMREFIARQVSYQEPRCPQPWAAFSPEYAHPFVHVLQPELNDPRFVSTAPLNLDYLGSHPVVQKVFTSNNIDASDQRRSLLEEAARSRPSRFLGMRERLLIERVRGAAAIPLLDRADRRIQRPGHVQPVTQLADRGHPRIRRQRRIRRADPRLLPRSARPAGWHLGNFPGPSRTWSSFNACVHLICEERIGAG